MAVNVQKQIGRLARFDQKIKLPTGIACTKLSIDLVYCCISKECLGPEGLLLV